MSRSKNLVTGGVAFKCQVPRAWEEREVLEAKDTALVVSDGLPVMRAQLGIRVVAAEAGNFENPDHRSLKTTDGCGSRGWGERATPCSLSTPGTHLPSYCTWSARRGGWKWPNTRAGSRSSAMTARVVSSASTPKRPAHGGQLVDDILHRTETAVPQAHTFLASELAVRAQLTAAVS